MPDVPDWLRAYVDRCSDALGLNHLTLYYRLKPLGKRKNGGHGGGRARTDWRYNRGEMDFDVLIAPDADGYETTTHECLHVACLPMHRAVTRIIGLLPKEQRKHAWKLWSDGEEEAVTRLAHFLTPVLRPVPEPVVDGDSHETIES